MRISLSSSIAALTAIIALPLAAQAQNIDTVSSWNGSNNISSWGGSGTPTYGQSITAPVGVNTLDTFSFRINTITNNYRAYVYSWDPVARLITGSQLWDSGTLSLNTAGFTAVNFAPNIAITPGNTYMLFASVLGESGSGATGWGYSGTSIAGADTYSGGGFSFSNDSSFGALSTNAWSNPGTFGFGSATSDLAFTATFSPSSAAPEPPVGMLLLSALLPFGLMGARKRFQKTQA
jgi:hypothetical protein